MKCIKLYYTEKEYICFTKEMVKTGGPLHNKLSFIK